MRARAGPGGRHRVVGPDVAKVAALIGDRARARMLFALLDGGEIPASELALRASVSPQSASGHLRRLVEGMLVTARRAGRQRLFRLASPQVAAAVETLAAIAPHAPIVSMSQHSAMERLRRARTCYDHLAGRLGVGVTEALVRRGTMRLRAGQYHLTNAGKRFFSKLGVEVDSLGRQRRPFARACTDWTERRPHLAGSLGAALLDRLLAAGWVRRCASDRALSITPAGSDALARTFGVGILDPQRADA
jgi:DNA-binding transcriptional ArsR family regulator